jgi:hypothetical protein
MHKLAPSGRTRSFLRGAGAAPRSLTRSWGCFCPFCLSLSAPPPHPKNAHTHTHTHKITAQKKARETAAKSKAQAPVIDVTQHGIFKVLGKGQLPAQPVVVKAKFFSKLAERKIKEVGGACVLTA